MRRVTLRDLAARLDLTPAAVSMALRNHPRISEETRRRVQALAQELGYVPDPALARLAELRRQPASAETTMPLAVVLQKHPRYPAWGAAEERIVREHAAGLGYTARTYFQDDRLPADRLVHILHATGVEAVLLGPVFDAELLEKLNWDQYSVVAWEAGYVAPPCHLVLPDVAHSIIQSTITCHQRGYRRIGIVLFEEMVPPVDHFFRRGAIDYCVRELARDGLQIHATEVPSDRLDRFAAWFRRVEPDAVIGQTELLYWWLKEVGHEPGRDVGFVTLHRRFRTADPRITGYDDDRSRTALVALRLLDLSVRHFERGMPDLPQRVLLQMPWHEGITLPSRTPGEGASLRRVSRHARPQQTRR